VHIEQAQVRAFSQGRRDGFGAAPSLGADLDPAAFEILAESAPDPRMIIRDQNPQERCSHLVQCLRR